MQFPNRISGILLHPTSLPGRFGIGDFGPDAVRFVDVLRAAGQTVWQILPLGPTGYGNSPYMCFSAFAANPMLISPAKLVERRLLKEEDAAAPPAFPADRVDFPAVIEWKRPLLRKAFAKFCDGSDPALRDDYYAFCERNAFWLEDYALFRALKSAHEERVWTDWEAGVAHREPASLTEWRNRLAEALTFRRFVQFLTFQQWAELKAYCHEQGIQVVGDMPIYVAHDSADVWANRELFQLDGSGQPTVVAGVPPDYFSAAGQRWGNPIYRWDAMEEQKFQWWKDRFRMTLAQVDCVRMDHFRGLESYWEIPAAQKTAVNGRWVKAPGAKLFQTLLDAVGTLPVIAEDLGVITAEVEALRDQFELPGMRILQMAFGTDPMAAAYRPHNHIKNAVVYTATHDHNTTTGWFTAPPGTETTQTEQEVRAERTHVLAYLHSDGRDIHWDMIRLALGSVANLAVFPLQDVLGLDSQHRMNRPGTLKGNWEWRFTWEQLTPDTAARLADLTKLYERPPSAAPSPEEGQPLSPSSATDREVTASSAGSHAGAV
jgi:4-alpha-glucanotransferase